MCCTSEPGSLLGRIISDGDKTPARVAVNSSHHQSAEDIGKGLRVAARCPNDRIVEAVEGVASDHFVLAVQWHPERSVNDDEPSRRIFNALVEAAKALRRNQST